MGVYQANILQLWDKCSKKATLTVIREFFSIFITSFHSKNILLLQSEQSKHSSYELANMRHTIAMHCQQVQPSYSISGSSPWWETTLSIAAALNIPSPETPDSTQSMSSKIHSAFIVGTKFLRWLCLTPTPMLTIKNHWFKQKVFTQGLFRTLMQASFS